MTVGAWLCLAAPLAATLLIVLLGSHVPARVSALVAIAGCLTAFGGAVYAFVDAIGLRPDERTVTTVGWTWLEFGQASGLKFDMSLLIDPVAMFMMLIISGVGALIIIYSLGYLDGEREMRRYFAYISFFVFSMLLLVETANLLLLLAGWGLVGLSSYLLIGFHHERPSAVAAAKKAFIVNAIGDAALALALFLIIKNARTLDVGQAVFNSQGQSDLTVWLIAGGLLIGAIAKSAQLPLHTWLPDAMEGPTPVSALIHAATMVTAGVYLIVRTHLIFEAAPHMLELVAAIGAATLLVAGLIALVQNDIKRVIAYSTMSQIGYMFLGAGLKAYPQSMFHLMTHAFFKALLFLGAGLVIHALAGQQDLRNMGGLRKHMPKTTIAMLVGALALVGMPPFSGFFSKDAILAASLANGGWGAALWVVGMAGCYLTGVYTFRLIFMVFYGEESAHVKAHPPHESGDRATRWSMAATVGILAVLATVAGWAQFEHFYAPITDFLGQSAGPSIAGTGRQELITSIFAVGLGGAGIWTAWYHYYARKAPPPESPAILRNAFWFDAVYDRVFYRPSAAIARLLFGAVERPLVDGSVTGVAHGVRRLGRSARGLQTGLVRTYVLATGVGVAVLVVVFMAVR